MGQMFRAFSPAEGNGTPYTQVMADGSTRKGIRGYDPEDGILVPKPGRTQPKHGHWRISGRARLRVQGVKSVNIRDNPLNSGRVDGDYLADENRVKESRKQRRRRQRMHAYEVMEELGIEA